MEPIDYIKKPQVICRLFSTLFSIVVFGCISDKGKDYRDRCFYDGDNGACNYGVAIGVIAFLLCLLFLAADYFMDSINSVEVKKYIMVADLLLSAMWSFLWFVCFCYLCDKWRKTDGKKVFSKNNAQAAIAFSFFSIISWVSEFLVQKELHVLSDGMLVLLYFAVYKLMLCIIRPLFFEAENLMCTIL